MACSGRPGPVVLALPEDMLVERAEAPNARPCQVIEAAPSPAQMAQLLERLGQARNPVAIVGGSRWDAEAVARFQDFAAAHALPVACSFRRQMLFDHQHPCYAGDLGLGVNPALLARILGTRKAVAPAQATEIETKLAVDRIVNEQSWFVEADCSASTTVLGFVVRPHMVVPVEGVGDALSGSYQVMTATHVFTTTDQLVDFTLRANGFQGGSDA